MDVNFQRKIPVRYDVDVFVAGGGPAGVAAGVVAARQGRSVFLAEGHTCLGGMGTAGLVPALAPYNYNQQDGEPYLRGIAWEVVERLDAAGGLYGLGKHQWWKLFDKEIAKSVFEKMALEAGVSLRYFTFFHTVEMDGPMIRRALSVSKAGLEAWRLANAGLGVRPVVNVKLELLLYNWFLLFCPL